MANITDPRAINFSNNQVRPVCDLLAQAYNRCNAVNQRWVALGSNQTALNQMQPDILKAANRILDAYNAALLVERVWFGVSGLSALFPNDSSPVFDNGAVSAQDATRPPIAGANVNNAVTRCVEFQNWLLSAAGAFNGTLQVETATAAGTITGAGNATVVVTAYGMSNSPKTVSVAVANADTASAWAGKVRTALAADADVGAFFTMSGAAAAIVLTAKATQANDNGMNVSLANGTSTGITAAPTSANTTAGVAARGGVSWLNTVIQCSQYGPTPIVLADAQNFLTRCGELTANYQAGSNANLNVILTAAVNPNPTTAS